jgi:hypothetical protein
MKTLASDAETENLAGAIRKHDIEILVLRIVIIQSGICYGRTIIKETP